ncbi:hypothetical protein XENTR_v10009836, partial [Xenopus tropicalis]
PAPAFGPSTNGLRPFRHLANLSNRKGALSAQAQILFIRKSLHCAVLGAMDPGYRGSFMQTSVHWEGFNIPQLPLYGPQWSRSCAPVGPQYKSFETSSDEPQAAHSTTLPWPPECSSSNWGSHQGAQSQGTPAVGWQGFGDDTKVRKRKKKNKKKQQMVQLGFKTPTEDKPSTSASSTQGRYPVSHKHREENQEETREKDTKQNGTPPKTDRGAKPPKKKKRKGNHKEPQEIVPEPKPPAKDAKSESSATEFHCFLCKYQTDNRWQIAQHFRSTMHKEVIKELHRTLPKYKVAFIEEYLHRDVKKVVSERRQQHLAVSKTYSLKGIGQEHFMQQVQAVRCSACDLLLPNVIETLLKHTASESHALNRRMMFGKTVDGSVIVAKKFFLDKDIIELLDNYMEGNNFIAKTTHKGALARKDIPKPDAHHSDGGECQLAVPVQLQNYKEEYQEIENYKEEEKNFEEEEKNFEEEEKNFEEEEKNYKEEKKNYKEENHKEEEKNHVEEEENQEENLMHLCTCSDDGDGQDDDEEAVLVL